MKLAFAVFLFCALAWPLSASEVEHDIVVLTAERTIEACIKHSDKTERATSLCWDRWRSIYSKHGAAGIVMLAKESEPNLPEHEIARYLRERPATR